MDGLPARMGRFLLRTNNPQQPFFLLFLIYSVFKSLIAFFFVKINYLVKSGDKTNGNDIARAGSGGSEP